ncbi:S-layer homology domain-containing protein [Syntrophomonas curvata]
MRKTSRNIFTCSFIFLLLLTLTGVAAAVPADSKSEASVSLFNDVSSSDVNVLYINYMAARGLISGFPDGSFHPADGLTRAQAAALLCRVKGLDTTSAAPSSFADVAGSHWAVSYINAAYQAGYISGFPDNTYQPEAMLTRAQGISLFLRTSSAPDTGEESVSLEDMNKSHWAAAAMATALAAGMITTDGNKINPEQAFNRGDAAKALSILLTQDPGLNQNQLTGKLKAKGKVSLKRAGSDEAQPVSAPAIVKAGDTIITGNDGEAEINFPDGSGILLKHNTQISITEAKGRAFIKSGGMPGTAVDNLEIELSQGKIFGALASKYTGNPEDNHTAANNKHKLLASRDQNFDLLAAKEGEQWYKTAEKKKVKVKVDMPWGVAAIRGSFWSNTVSGTGCGMTLLEGEGNLSSGGQTQNLSPGQSSGIGTQGTPPSPPGPMNPSEARDWSQQRGWVTDRASDMQNNRETPLGAPQGNQSGSSPMGNLTNILNQALNQAQITAGNQTGTGGGGSNNPGAQQVMAPTATPPAGSYITVPTVTLSTTTTGAAIYYTIDGSDPKTSNTRAVYSTPFNVAASATVKAYAVKTGMSDSQVVSFAYTIASAPPTIALTLERDSFCLINGDYGSIEYSTSPSDANVEVTANSNPDVATLNLNCNTQTGCRWGEIIAYTEGSTIITLTASKDGYTSSTRTIGIIVVPRVEIYPGQLMEGYVNTNITINQGDASSAIWTSSDTISLDLWQGSEVVLPPPAQESWFINPVAVSDPEYGYPTIESTLRSGLEQGMYAIVVLKNNTPVAITTIEVIPAQCNYDKSTTEIDGLLALETSRTVTAVARTGDGTPVPGYRFILDIGVTNNDAATAESYLIDGISYTADATGVELTTSANADGITTFNIVLPSSIDNGDGISIKAKTENYPYPQYVINNYMYTQGNQAPELTAADPAYANTAPEYCFDITFTDDQTWRNNITGVVVGGITLADKAEVGPYGAYELGEGYLRLYPADAYPLQNPGQKYITVKATGYEDTAVLQMISLP